MSDNHRLSYRTLVAALRWEFTPIQIEALKIQLDEHRYETGTVGVLRQAVSDAWDVAYDATVARTEYAWSDGRTEGGEPILHRASVLFGEAQEQWVRTRAAKSGAVYVREVTDWRPEP